MSDRTWIKQWQNIGERLPDKELTADTLIMADILASQYQGKYEQSKVKKRDRLTDDVIARWREHIPNLAWRSLCVFCP